MSPTPPERPPRTSSSSTQSSSTDFQINLGQQPVPEQTRAPPAPPPIMTSPPDTSPLPYAPAPQSQWNGIGGQDSSVLYPAPPPSATIQESNIHPAKQRNPRDDKSHHRDITDSPMEDAQPAGASSHGQARGRRHDGSDRRRRKERAAAEHVRELEEQARRLFIWGFFALPLLWLVSLLYFRKEHVDENASQIIKKYYVWSLRMFIVYTIIFVAWFIVFQVNSNSLSALNILSYKGRGPSGL